MLSLTNTLYNMKKITGNEPAMPSSVCCNENGIYIYGNTSDGGNGLTIREKFAMAAMQGLLSNETSILRKPSEIATMAVLASYALINELNK